MTVPLQNLHAVGLLAVGGALGSVARFGVSLLWVSTVGAGVFFPWATLMVNTLGALGIGLAASLTAATGRWPLCPALRQALMAGFFGGFTTFSFFSLEVYLLLTTGAAATALAYIAASILLWLGAVYLGRRWGKC